MSVSWQWTSHSCISCVISQQVKKMRKSNPQNSVFEDWPLLVRYQLEKTEVSMSRLCSLTWEKLQALTTIGNRVIHIVTVCLCATPEVTWKQLLRPERLRLSQKPFTVLMTALYTIKSLVSLNLVIAPYSKKGSGVSHKTYNMLTQMLSRGEFR